MMSKILLLLVLLLLGSSLFAEETSEALTEGMVNPGYHDKPAWFKESFLDIREDIQEATDQDKRVMLYFYQDGCPYCGKLLQDNFGDRDISLYTKKNFDVISINMWGDREVVNLAGETTTEKAFAKNLRVQFTPTLLFLNEQGKVLLRINGYFAPYKFMTTLQYIAEKKENSIAIRDYFRTIKPEKASGQLHTTENTLKNPADLTERNSATKPLLVMFEQPVCKACDELHLDILKRDNVKASLQAFDVVVLNMWSDQLIRTPAGQNSKIKEWSNQLGINYSPSLVFFDAQGDEIFRTEAYMKSFHTKAALDYVSTGTYKTIPEFQRYVQKIADDLHARGIEFDLMD